MRTRLRNLAGSSGWAFIALLVFLQGLATLITPSQLSLNIVLTTLNVTLIRAYSLFLVAAGGCTLYGIGFVKYKIQQIGLLCLVPAMVIHMYIIAVGPSTPIWNRSPLIVVYLCFGATIYARYKELHTLTKGLERARTIAGDEHEL